MRKVYHKILQIAGNVITVEAENVAYNELAEVTSSRGQVSLETNFVRFYRISWPS